MSALPPAETDPLSAPEAGARALRGGLVRSGGFAAGVGLSLLSAPLLVRHLGIGTFGRYVTISAVVTVVAGISDLGLTSVGVREWATIDPRRRHDLMRDLLGARLALTTAGVCGAMLFGVAAGYDATGLEGLAVASAGLLLLALQNALAVPLQAGLRQGWQAIAELVRQSVQVAVIVLGVLLGAGLVSLLAAAIPAAAAAVIVTGAVAREALVAPALHPRRWWSLLRDTLPFAAASALSVLYLRTTVIITSLVATAVETGYFGAAFRVMEVLINIPVLTVGAAFPILARAASEPDRTRIGGALAAAWNASLFGGATMAVLVVAGAPAAIEVLVGHRAAHAAEALELLGVGLGFSFVGAVCQYGLLAMRRHRAILLINAVALAVNATLTLTLAPGGGARGAALALGLSELTVAGLATVLVRRDAGTLGLDRRRLLATATAALGAAAAGLACAGLGQPAPLLGAGVAYAVLVMLTGALPPQIAAALRSRQIPATGGVLG